MFFVERNSGFLSVEVESNAFGLLEWLMKSSAMIEVWASMVNLKLCLWGIALASSLPCKSCACNEMAHKTCSKFCAQLNTGIETGLGWL